MESFAERIKELRIAAGYSQEKLAEQLGITMKSIQRYEKNCRPDTYVLVKLASFFNVSTDYLLGLKSYEEQKKERSNKLVGTKQLYAQYLKCLNDYEIAEDTDYYWIELESDHIGGQTCWAGWADEESKMEIRVLRPVIPESAIAMCTMAKGKPMVLNSELDAKTFLVYGGQAIVRKDICEKYLPQFMEEMVMENPQTVMERKLLEEYELREEMSFKASEIFEGDR
ncbi:HTH-type transcriptional regulator immR [uncultured Eubacterium sp.]|nr:HTH-type transcriptional regulator immR [uncultured Eubacterium sp.]